MAGSGCRRLLGDDFDDAVVQRQRRVAGLLRHPSDHRDRTDRVVERLVPPCGDRRIVQGAVEDQTELHVPPQAARIAGGFIVAEQRIRRLTGERVPVPRRCLRGGSIRPVLGNRPVVVGCIDVVRLVRLAGHRVLVMACRRLVAHRRDVVRPRSDVHRRLPGLQVGRRADHLDRLIAVLRRRGVVTDPRRRTRVEWRLRIDVDGERRNRPPVGTDERLLATRERHPVLRHVGLEEERLPTIRIDDLRAGFGDDERRVDRLVLDVLVGLAFERTVVDRRGEHVVRHLHAERCGALGVQVGIVRLDATDPGQRGVQSEARLGAGEAQLVALGEDAVGGKGHGFVAGSIDVVGRTPLVDEHRRPRGLRWLVRPPHVPHGRRQVIQVAGVDGRGGEVEADRVERSVVPYAVHRRRIAR